MVVRLIESGYKVLLIPSTCGCNVMENLMKSGVLVPLDYGLLQSYLIRFNEYSGISLDKEACEVGE